MVEMSSAQADGRGRNAHPPRPSPRRTGRRSAVCETPKARATQARILDAAMRIIATEGYHAAQNARIAEAAEVARGVINYHFRTPAELASAIVAFVEQRKAESLNALAERLRTADREHVDAAIDGYWALLHETSFVAYAELEFAARTDAALRGLLSAPRRALDHGVSHSRALDRSDHAPSSDRQALYDLTRFLLEGLARGAMTYDRQVREARLIRLLKKAVRALDEPTLAQPLWID